jgi:N-acetyltransferase
MKIEPIILEGTHARLEPLRPDHTADLFAVAQAPEIWQFVSVAMPRTLADMQSWVNTALDTPNRQAFVIIEKASGRVAGCTSYLDIQPQNRSLEIGWTWLGRDFWRSTVNTECKYLLLQHAFEVQNAIRVTIKTDSRNLRSQQAIERIGGVREGILRRHMIYESGYIRDTVYYSVIDSEWAFVKARLEAKMNCYAPQEAVIR